MFHSLIIAFAMYSKIPMPRVEWKEKNMSYSLCFFPLVGAVISLCELGCVYLMKALSVSQVLTAVLMTVLPVLISGGIHMDGFLDTVDAKSSWRTMEERLRILKDPRTGAFAVIYGIVYFLVTFGLYYEITLQGLKVLAVGYVYERILSGASLVLLKKAKKDGMAAVSSDAAKKKEKRVIVIFAAEFLVGSVIFCMINPVCGGGCILAALLSFWHYRHTAYKMFGGVTGDLAGYFLQICELLMLAAVVLTGKLSAV